MRYFALVLLNVPIILLALVNIITQYKLNKITVTRLRHQVVMWLVVMAVLLSYSVTLLHRQHAAPADRPKRTPRARPPSRIVN